MSLNPGLQRFNVGGRIFITGDPVVAEEINAAIGSNVGVLCAANETPVDWVNGVPFTAAGQVAVEEAPLDHYGPRGLPITASGKVAVDVLGVVTHYLVGLPFTAEDRLAVIPIEVPPGESGFSTGFDLLGFA